jgi:predicted  nucleic acid-binding Zn-ribbon protein
MDPLCHRCGTVLNSADELFCPHCGAPQLRYEPSDEPTASSASLKQIASSRGLGAVSWKTAVLSALLVAGVIAVPVGLLSSILDLSSSFWVIGGGIATVSLYRRWSGVPLSNRMGWRVGGLLGLLSAFISTAVYSAKSVIERRLMRSSEVDQQVHSFVQQMASQATHSDPQTAAVMAQFTRFWLSPEGSAAIVLWAAAFSAFFMVLFAAAGGAIGARIASLGNRPQRSPQ